MTNLWKKLQKRWGFISPCCGEGMYWDLEYDQQYCMSCQKRVL